MLFIKTLRNTEISGAQRAAIRFNEFKVNLFVLGKYALDFLRSDPAVNVVVDGKNGR